MIYDISSRFLWIESVLSIINIQLLLLAMPTAKHKNTPLVKTLYSLVVIGIALFLFFPNNDFLFIPELLCYSLIFIIPLFSISGLSKSAIVYTLFLYLGIELTLSSIITWGVDITIPQTALVTYIELILHVLLSVIILLTRRKITNTVTHPFRFLSTRIRILIIVFIWVGGGLIYTLSCFEATDSYVNIFIFITISTAALLILFLIMFPITISKELSTKYYQNLFSESEKQIERQVQHYQLLSEKNTELRQFRHDYNNLYIGLKSFLEKRDCVGALKYLNDCDETFKQIEQSIRFQTGNAIADALLTEKQQRALADNIRISFSGHLPTNGIDPMDLCVILGNPLDNAIEACQKLLDDSSKSIVITTKFRSNMLIIDIYNPVEHPVKITNNTISTSKMNLEAHGFGIYSLQQTLKKYHGLAQFTCVDCIFKTEISLIALPTEVMK